MTTTFVRHYPDKSTVVREESPDIGPQETFTEYCEITQWRQQYSFFVSPKPNSVPK